MKARSFIGPARCGLASRGVGWMWRLTLIALAATAACDDDSMRPDPTPLTTRVSFDQLAVGQESLYLFFSCDRYGAPDQATQTYDADTLRVAVIDQSDDHFRMEESLTPGSASRHGATNVQDPEAVFTYWLRVAGDSVFVFDPPGSNDRSRLFQPFGFGTEPAYFSLAPVADPETQFIGWQPDLPYHESFVTAFTPNHTQLGGAYGRLNILMENRGMQVDGPGHLYAYSGKHGVVRRARYSWWTQSGSGWDLLPERSAATGFR